MDIGTFRGLITVVLLLAFVALVVWLFFMRRPSDFDKAAAMPLEENEQDGDGK